MLKQKEALAKAKRELKEAARDAFRKAADEFFAAHPELLSFSWKQYHSETNREYGHPFACLYDNCPLTFREGDKTIKLTHEGYVCEVVSAPGDEFWDGYETLLRSEPLLKKALKLSGAVRRLVTSFEDDELEAAFGDPVTVTVTPKEFKVEEYWDFE